MSQYSKVINIGNTEGETLTLIINDEEASRVAVM